MTTRVAGATASIDWLRQAINLGRTNPKAIFGGAALLLFALLMLVVLMVALLMAVGLVAKPEGATASVFSVAIAAAMMALMAALIAGYLRLLDAVENGRPATAASVFSAFSEKGIVANAVLFMLALMVAQNLLVFGLIGVLAPDFGSWYLQNMQASITGATQPPTLPSGFGIAMAIMWVIGIFAYGVQSIGFGQIALHRRGVGAALADGVAGAAKNLLPLLVLFLAMVLAAIILAVVMVLLVLIVGVLGKLVGSWLVVLVGIPLYIAFVVVMMVVMFGVMYFMWRDICGEPPAPEAPRDDLIEV